MHAHTTYTYDTYAHTHILNVVHICFETHVYEHMYKHMMTTYHWHACAHTSMMWPLHRVIHLKLPNLASWTALVYFQGRILMILVTRRACTKHGPSKAT